MKSLKIYSGVITIVVIILLGVVFGSKYFSKDISKDEALNIAYSYVGVSENEVTNTKVEVDYEDREYEISFYDGTYKYEINISYVDGSIKEYEKDIYASSNTSSDTQISSNDAITIALNEVGLLEDEVKITKTKLTTTKGVTVYKIEFTSDTYEYEIEVNAITGEIVSYSEEALVTSSTSSSEYIGIDAAKEVALNHAGLTNSEVIWHKAELDIGYITTYEIEFYYNYLEYEYEINAITGEIIHYEIDRD